MNILMQLLGRLHPLLVHLPIGFIILGFLFLGYDRKKNELTSIISISFLWGGITATLACITGYLLYQSEGYSYNTIQNHLWFGIATTVFSFLFYFRLAGFQFINFLKVIPVFFLSVITLVLISFTGHLGGNITHGEDYLFEPLPNTIKKQLGINFFEEKTINLNNNNWKDALLYEDVVHPILNNKCVSCHNSKKNKGELSLSTKEDILKGGEKGEIITTNNPDKSSIYKRLILPKSHEDVMPPDGKDQLSKAETQIIMAWIKNGNSFDKSINELGLEKELLRPFFPKKQNNNHPDIFIEKAPQIAIDSIKSTGTYVELISSDSNFLSISCVNNPNFTNEDFDLLTLISNNISILDIGGTKVTDSIFEKINKLPNLTVLKLDNTAVTGEQAKLLFQLKNLRSVNLSNTKFEGQYLSAFSNFKKLKYLYLYNTNIKPEETNNLKHEKLVIDFGNYNLPVLKSDSILY